MIRANAGSSGRSIITIGVSLVVASFFMWLAFRGLNVDEVSGYFSRANYFWVAVSACFGLLAYWFRAVRWNILLEPMGYQISTFNSFWSISFGYLMNLTIPRSGELARASALYRTERVPVDKSFGTVISERVVDLVCMLLFFVLTLLFKFKAIAAFYEKSGIRIDTGTIALVLVLVAFAAAAIIVLNGKLKNVRFFSKISDFLEGIWLGLVSIFKLKHPLKFIALSAGIWFCYFMAAYLVCFSLPETSQFSVADGFFIIVVGTLGMMIPASGGIGTFHFALKLGIGALFLSAGKSFSEGESAGLAYAFISHTMQLIIMVAMGFLSIPFLAKSRRAQLKKTEFPKQGQTI